MYDHLDIVSCDDPDRICPLPFIPHLLGLLVQVGHRDARRQLGKVGVLGGHVGRRLGGELIQLDRGNARVHALDHLF